MTMIGRKTVKCAVCGHEQEIRVLYSTNSFGYMDLDTRPAGMARSTYRFAVTQCEQCGYACSDIRVAQSEQIAEWMKSDEYRAMLCDFHTKPARRFLCAAFIYCKMNKHDIAGRCYLYAAWEFDDVGYKDFAEMSRLSAIEQFTEVYEETGDLNFAAIAVDLKRRICDFDGAKQLAEKLLTAADDELLRSILVYQIRLCKDSDSFCHNVGEAIGDKGD